MIEKLVKEFEKIRTSLAKSKKLIIADIDKIDEKYRKLAQEEKKSLTESLAVLNEQLKYYDKMLSDEPIVEDIVDESPEEALKAEEEPVIQDTIFPENNEPEVESTPTAEKDEKPVFETTYPENDNANEVKEETKTTEEPVPSDGSTTADDSNVEWPEPASDDNEKKEEEAVPVITTDDNDWPIPEDWK